MTKGRSEGGRQFSGQQDGRWIRASLEAVLLLGLVAAVGGVGAQGTPEYDILIRNGRIVDGAGNAWFRGDVGIRAGRIARIGRLEGARAGRVIDAAEKVVAPGFIDVHMHVERSLPERPTADNLVADGVTSIVTGNCGGSEVAIGAWFERLQQSGVGVNVATLVGHNAVRRRVMGTENRAATPEELARMEALVARAMEEGAVGLSTGLVYVPGTYAATEEVVALARVAARSGGLYATHMRNEEEKVFEAIEEALQIAREAGLPLEISHFKVSNKLLWGASSGMLARVQRARAEGLDVTVDQYPYTASSTGLGRLVPTWALAGGREAIRRRLADPAEREKIAEEMYENIRGIQGQKHLEWAVVARARWNPELEGKSIREINRVWGRKDELEEEIQTVLDMMARGRAQMVYHRMDERDVVRILSHPLVMLGRDGGVPEFGTGKPHPRNYGAAARLLGRYVREKKVLRLEEAIRKMTSLPAGRFGFEGRGLLREGMWADIVVFDPQTVRDRATFDDPHEYSRGIDYVLVNGELV
ncbi:MAG: amidohydrolase family protein, partial [Terriglobia bacterium]